MHIFTLEFCHIRTVMRFQQNLNIDGDESVRVSHNAKLVTRMPLATIALLCKQTSDNFRTRPPPELPMAPSIGYPVIICSSLYKYCIC